MARSLSDWAGGVVVLSGRCGMEGWEIFLILEACELSISKVTGLTGWIKSEVCCRPVILLAYTLLVRVSVGSNQET